MGMTITKHHPCISLFSLPGCPVFSYTYFEIRCSRTATRRSSAFTEFHIMTSVLLAQMEIPLRVHAHLETHRVISRLPPPTPSPLKLRRRFCATEARPRSPQQQRSSSFILRLIPLCTRVACPLLDKSSLAHFILPVITI